MHVESIYEAKICDLKGAYFFFFFHISRSVVAANKFSVSAQQCVAGDNVISVRGICS